MLIFAANEGMECLLQFGVVGFFLLLSFISWVIKQVSAAGSQRALRQRLAERQPDQPSTNSGRGQSKEAYNPYSTGEDVYNAEIIEATSDRQIGSQLSSEHLARHAAHLGDLDDRSREEGVHDHFDFEVGQLGDSSDAVHEDPNAEKLPAEAVTASEIVDIFRHPERIREAIILNEILARPENRWS